MTKEQLEDLKAHLTELFAPLVAFAKHMIPEAEARAKDFAESMARDAAREAARVLEASGGKSPDPAAAPPADQAPLA